MKRFLFLIVLSSCGAAPLQDVVHPECYADGNCRIVEHRLLYEGKAPLTQAQIDATLAKYRLRDTQVAVPASK